MFGFSFGEILVISLVTLVAVGPKKLPGMLKTMGQWARKLRKMTMDVRQQTGIDEMLRAEGIQLAELRSLMRGYHAPAAVHTPAPVVPTPAPMPRYEDPYGALEPDPTREYPLEGADAYGALPDDLLEPPLSSEVATAPGDPEPVKAEEPSTHEPVKASEPAATPTLAATPSAIGSASSPEIEPEPEPEPKPPSVESTPVRLVPPPPPSRTGVPRPSGTPPPPPRRSSGPPRPEPSSPENMPEAAPAATPSSPGTANGNG